VIVDLFKIPIFIGNIDSKKISLKNKVFKDTWMSKTKSTYEQSLEKNYENIDNIQYLLDVISKILQEKVKYSFKLSLINIWENNYINNDYQEPHIHPESDFSFIIYKKVNEGKTVFLNPIKNYLILYKNIQHMFDETFMPKCKTNQIVIFPSFLEHMVLKSTNQITISGNLRFIKIDND